MKRLMTLAVAAVLAVSVTNFAFAAKTKKMKIVSFTGQVQIKLKDGSIIGLVPGAPVPNIPSGAEVIIVSGKAVFDAGGTIVTASKGDSFTFNTSGNTVKIAATGSKTNITVKVGKTSAALTSGSAVAVETTGKTTTLSVTAGSVAVTSGGTTTTLAAGESTTATTTSTTTTADSGDTDTGDTTTDSETTSDSTTSGESPIQNVETAPPPEVSPSSP